MFIRRRLIRLDMLGAIAAPLTWSLYLAVPVAGWGWLNGVPLGPAEATAAALVWWSWALRRRLPRTGVAVALIIAKIAFAGVFVERGFAARYYANNSWTPPVEQSLEFVGRPFTRIDDRLRFGVGPPDLPLYFLNDNRRFNFYLPTEPRRQLLAYSATWTGFLRVDDDRAPASFYVTVDGGASGELTIDGREVIRIMGGSNHGSLPLGRGWHALTLRVAAPYGAGRSVEAGELIGETVRPFDSRRVFVEPVGTARLVADAALRWMTSLVDVGVLAWLGWVVIAGAREAWRDRRIGFLLWLGAIAEALRFSGAYAGRAVMLGGGDDFLTYETFARAIVLEDVLRFGQSAPFYFQPLYPYVVALAHVAFGEDLFGIVLVQRLLVAATVGWVGAMTARLFGGRAGWAAVAFGALFLYDKLGRWSDVVLAEPIFTPLLAAWIWTLIRIATEGLSLSRIIGSGVVGGLATLTRSTLLLAWPVILPLWWRSIRGPRARAMVVLLLVMSGIVGTATVRNWIVARKFVPVTTSFSVNLSMGNLPPQPLAPAPPERTAMYERLGVDAGVRGVAEYVVQQPAAFVAGLGRKAVYSLGLFGLSGVGVFRGIAWPYVSVWAMALVGIAMLLHRLPRCQSPAMWLPLAGAVTHFGAIVLIFPYGYGDRLIVPLYPLLIPYAAVALEPVARYLQPYAVQVWTRLAEGGRRSGQTARLWGARALGVSVGWTKRHGWPAIRPALRQPRAWLYLAYTAAVVLRLDWRPADRDETSLATALLLPVTTFAVARLTRAGLWQRVAGGALFAAAVLRVLLRGSLSADALHDPFFWGAAAIVALSLSAAAGRWRVAAIVMAALAGATAMIATLLPVFPDFESMLPVLNGAVIRQSYGALVYQLGEAATILLIAIWLYAIVFGGRRGEGVERIGAAARGALAAALVLSLAGAVPTNDGIEVAWIAALGVLLGLAEAKARSHTL